MNILLTSASGFIGRALYWQLLARGHHLVVCVHKARATSFDVETQLIPCDFNQDTDISAWLLRLVQIDVVINTVGIFHENAQQRFAAIHHQAPVALFAAAAQLGVKRVINLSALGADAEANVPYHLSKRAADEALMQYDLDWYVLRPSLVYGTGGESFALFRALSTFPINILPDGGTQGLQPIHVDDLCLALLRCAEGTVASRQIIHAVGDTRLSLREYLAQLRQQLGLGVSPVISLPLALLMPLAWLAEQFQHSLLSRDSLRMLQRGNCADVQAFIAAVGFRPRSFEQGLKQLPPTQAERWHSGLYLLRPLLRLSIAVTWLSAGLVSAFFYPVAQSYDLLANMGVPDSLAPVLLYGAAALDCVLGLAMLNGRWLRWAAYTQISIMLIYTVLISLRLPIFWLDPFGAIVKNIPLLIATLMMLQLEKK